MNSQLEGIYAPYIKQYINFKRSLGYKFNTEATVLSLFDRFSIKKSEKIVGITKNLAIDWLELNPNESPSYKYHRCLCLNQLASYLSKIGFPSYILPLPPNPNTFTPYIFSRKQVADLFEASDGIIGKKKGWIPPF